MTEEIEVVTTELQQERMQELVAAQARAALAECLRLMGPGPTTVRGLVLAQTIAECYHTMLLEIAGETPAPAKSPSAGSLMETFGAQIVELIAPLVRQIGDRPSLALPPLPPGFGAHGPVTPESLLREVDAEPDGEVTP